MKNKQFNKTLAGKTGKDLLSLMSKAESVAMAQNIVPPSTAFEISIYDHWKTLLKRDDFGVHDDFFKWGGNSLKAIQLLSRLATQFSADISLTDIFLKPTIAQIAEMVSEKKGGSSSTSFPGDIKRPPIIPLSFNQERLWFIDQLEGSAAYHVPAVFRLKGTLNKSALAYAWEQIIKRHEVLRTVIRKGEQCEYQFIQPYTDWQLSFHDRTAFQDNARELQSYVQQLINKRFDLSKDYMLRADLIRLGTEEHLLVLTIHHIATDGWSTGIIIKELLEFYKAFESGIEAAIEPLPVQYAEFAIWQRQYLQGEVLNKKLSYWQNALKDIETLQLPTDYPRQAVQTFTGRKEEFFIDKTLTAEIQALSNQQGVTIFMTLLAIFKVLLYRYSGQRDISVGTATAGRRQKELEGLVGFFVNTVVLRSHINDSLSFSEFLAEVKTGTLEAFEHQDVPFEKIVEAVMKERDISRSPLFQVMFIVQNTPEKETIHLGDLVLAEEPFENNQTKFELDISITQTELGLQGAVMYCADLYNAQTIRKMMGHFIELLKSAVKSPHQNLASLPILGSEEQQALLNLATGATTDYPGEKNIIALFEEQVNRTPGSIALTEQPGKAITYNELNERSNQLAYYLKTAGIKPGSLIPVCMELSIDLVVGILGILKAGAAYVPIDTAYPWERIGFMLEDTAATIFITNNSFVADVENKKSEYTAVLDPLFDAAAAQLIWKQNKIELLCLDDEKITANPTSAITLAHPPSAKACIIYTSGSSGRPKGVQLTHEGIVNRLHWMWQTFPFEAGEKNAIKTSVGFVDHVWELFGALNQGISSVIFTKDILLDLDVLLLKLQQEKISRLVLVPSLLKTLLLKLREEETSLPHLKYWTSSGESLPAELVVDFYTIFPATSHKLLNIYGSSEVTADVSYYDTSLSVEKLTDKNLQAVPIGKPISNTRIYLLDQYQQIVPQGVIGEICVAGLPVADGYLNLPQLTTERFIEDPFGTKPGTKMFRTGDYGRLLRDGNIVCFGRIDDQVKIRGNRVEPGEIETVVRQTGLVQDCIIIAKKDYSGLNYLVGYITGASNIDQQALANNVRDKLPDYMVPASWVQCESLPLTASGKVDKKALPDPARELVSAKIYIAPANELQQQLALAWQQLLNKERIGVYDNFFELGGHSLLGMRLISAIRKMLSIDITIKDLFVHPTIASLAKYIEGQNNKALIPAISKVINRPQQVPLSFSQERLWFIDQLNGSLQYHIPALLRLKGNLDKALLEDALKQIVNRHEVLRTIIETKDGGAYQTAKPANEWRLYIADRSDLLEDVDALSNYIKQLIEQPYNLSADSLLRATLITLAEEEYLLVATLHHIASDGWSTGILVNELTELYNAAIEKRVPVLSSLPFQYSDFAIWQRTLSEGEAWNTKLAYWKQQLQGVDVLQLPTDHPRPLMQSTRGASINIQLDKQLAEAIQVFNQRQEVTMFMTLVAAFNVLLYRYTGQHDICIGTPIAGRQQQELEGLIGFFVNTLALRSELHGGLPFEELLQQVKNTTLDAYQHQDVPIEKVVELVVKERDMSRSPLFQVVLALQNMPETPHLRLGNVQVSLEDVADSGHHSSKFDLSFIVSETSNGLNLRIEYCTDLFHESTVLQMGTHFGRLLRSIVDEPNQQVGVLPMLQQSEIHHLLNDFNPPLVPFPESQTVLELIAVQVTKNPDSIALVFNEEKLTYRELDERSNRLANYLISKGVKKDMLVPVCVQRGTNIVISLLAILKAGGAYVPIDPDYPADRIRFMLEDTRASLLLTSTALTESLMIPENLIVIDTIADAALISNEPATALPILIESDQLAYVIYTSGSTGKPKGVMIEHRSLANLVQWHKEAYHVTSSTRATAMAGVGFDAFGWEVWPYLSFGASLYVIDDQTKIDLSKLIPLLADEKITHSFIATALVPAITRETLNKNTSLQYLLTGGDKLPAIDSSGLSYQLVNNYGPTENTVVTSYYKLINNETAVPPIGKPILNTSIYLLNENQQLAPQGVAGELCIGGAQLARGYLNQPDLTAISFIDHPFDKTAGAKLYRSGDLCKWLPDGNLEYLGRIDDQVKIRGYRIELGEIETCLLQSGKVNQAVILAKAGNDGNKILVGYVVAGDDFNRDKIIAYLKEKLPEYMVPAHWIKLTEFPLTNNGKINKKALPEPDLDELVTAAYTAPGSVLENKLAEIWKESLQVERPGIHDNFFELGGHSLKAMQVVSQVRKILEAPVQIRDLFYHPTIALLATYIEQVGKESLLPPVQKQVRPNHIPLSFSQERLWFIDQLEGSIPYNSPTVLRLKGMLNRNALNHALQQIIQRHEVLQSVFYDHEGRPHQKIIGINNWQLELIESDQFNDDPLKLQEFIYQLVSAPFNLSKDYMLRATLISLAPKDYLLVIALHHIAADAWSIPIIIKEVIELYTAFVQNRTPVLPQLPIQFADYAIWQRTYLSGDTLHNITAYWKQKLQGVTPLELPTDFNRPAVRSLNGASFELSLGETLSEDLNRLSQQQGTSLFMLLLAVYKVMLQRYSGQQDICVGASIANRPQQELEGLIGFFVNTLALRTVVDESAAFADLLQVVKTTTLEAYEHQDMPFEKLVEEVVKERDESRTPLFQVMLVLLNTPTPSNLSVDGLELAYQPLDNKISKFEITFHMLQSENGLTATIIYNTDLFREESIIRMAGHFKQLLQSVVQDPLQSVESLQMLTDAEEQQLLMEFN